MNNTMINQQQRTASQPLIMATSWMAPKLYLLLEPSAYRNWSVLEAPSLTLPLPNLHPQDDQYHHHLIIPSRSSVLLRTNMNKPQSTDNYNITNRFVASLTTAGLWTFLIETNQSWLSPSIEWLPKSILTSCEIQNQNAWTRDWIIDRPCKRAHCFSHFVKNPLFIQFVTKLRASRESVHSSTIFEGIHITTPIIYRS